MHTRELIASSAYGAVRMITALNYTDFLYRPRRPEELDTTKGGGALFVSLALPGGLITPEVTALISNGSAILASMNGIRPLLRYQ